MTGKAVAKRFLPMAFTAIFIAGASPSQAVVIDFDLSGPDGAVIPVGTFDALGVRFDQPLVVDTGNSGLAPGSGPNAVRSGDPADAYGDITGFFLGPVAAVDSLSVFAGQAGFAFEIITLTGFNAADAVVDSDTFSGQGGHTLSIAGSGIVRFSIVSSTGLGIDDFTFNPAAISVSEPATIGLLGAGFAGIGFMRRGRARGRRHYGSAGKAKDLTSARPRRS